MDRIKSGLVGSIYLVLAIVTTAIWIGLIAWGVWHLLPSDWFGL